MSPIRLLKYALEALCDNSQSTQVRKSLRLSTFLRVGAALPLLVAPTFAQINGVGPRSYVGWSSFSEQTIDGSFPSQANIEAQSDALKAPGLQQRGFQYINIDSDWQGSFDSNGHPVPNPSTFSDMKALVDHIHADGQKAGIYWIPDIEQPAVDGTYPIPAIPGASYSTQPIVAIPLAQGNTFVAPPPNPISLRLRRWII